VLAVDNDPEAVKAARENVAANAVEGTVSVVPGSLAEVTGNYDLAVVNILANVIVRMMQEGLAARIRPGGRLIATGILADQEPEVVAALEQEGLTLVERQQRDDWVCLVARQDYSCSDGD
jgi:ribosomal protein L11 methyltransferase